MTTRLFAVLPFAALLIAGALVGCKQEASYDPNYSTDIKMSEADKAKEKEIMADQTRPGVAGQPPQGLKPPPGKSGK
jgi:hypothetical protein